MSSTVKVVPLRVEMLARTETVGSRIANLYVEKGGRVNQRDYRSLAVAEVAGRGCYESYARTSEKTDSFEGYFGNILSQKHYSVLEHVSVSFYIEGISRAASHEIVRHRHFSFSQQSQRFCIVKKPYEVVIHPTLEEECGNTNYVGEDFASQFEKAHAYYEVLRKVGYSRKEAAEAARMYLPNAAATHMVITGNLRSWIEFISKRDHPAADKEIQIVAKKIYETLVEAYPEVFGEEARKNWDEDFAQRAVKFED